MPSKSKTVYLCSQCGFESPKWYGKCPSCGEWNTLNEEFRAPERPSSGSVGRTITGSVSRRIGEINPQGEKRCKTGLGELDRVLGGGIVHGALMLIGGDPGIGKSTLLLQICEHLGKVWKILYVSGEESERQIKLRADRLKVSSDNLYILCETDVDTVLEHFRLDAPDLVIIDSIQTMNLAGVASSSGKMCIRDSHGTQAHLAPDLMAEDHVRILCGPLLCDRSKPELRDLTPANPAILQKEGVEIALITDHPVIPEQYLPLCGGLAVREGLPYEEALKALTIVPAKICGIADRVGSITPGKDADLVLFRDDPLTVAAKPAAVFAMGRLVRQAL